MEYKTYRMDIFNSDGTVGHIYNHDKEFLKIEADKRIDNPTVTRIDIVDVTPSGIVERTRTYI